MFTGIIEGLGTIKAIQSAAQGKRFAIEADFDLSQIKIGASLAVSGACLTAVSAAAKRFEVDVSPETLAKTTLGRAKIGERVNIERALRLGDRLDGHLVSGHIDGMGTIKSNRPVGNAVVVTIDVADNLLRYMIVKGSVAVDGISLTINNCGRDGFEVSIIPHTAKLTTIGFKNPGDHVNIEVDMIGKYIERFITGIRDDKGSDKQSIDMQFLAKTGFL